MSAATPARRLTPRCGYDAVVQSSSDDITGLSYRPRVLNAQTECRAFSSSGHRKADKKEATADNNPILDRYRRDQAGSGASTMRQAQEKASREMLAPGDLSASSIFEDERQTRAQDRKQEKQIESPEGRDLDGERMITDPDPRAREKWLRKKVIQTIRHRGRMTPKEMLARTEREHLAKSENMKTSVKKLGALARQIAGKTLDDALVQMQFSKKLVAEKVYEHLMHAKHEATVARGMGLGAASAEETEEGAASIPSTHIRLKDGKKHAVGDPTTLYIDQAWVGRGPYGKLPDYRARGRVYVMRTPWTSLSIVLKEEKTRIREYNDRVAREKAKRLKNPWQPLPDKPISGYRGQHYSW